MKHQITEAWLIEKKACHEGIEYFKILNETDAIKIFLEMIKQKEHLEWANWAIVRLMKREQYVSLAIYSAEQVLCVFEEKFPGDDRSRKAIEAAKAVLEKDNTETRIAAYAAAYATCTATAAAENKSEMQIKILGYGMKLLRDSGECGMK